MSGDRRWRGTINGAALSQDWIDDLIDEGYGRMMTVGAQETGIVGGGAGAKVYDDILQFAPLNKAPRQTYTAVAGDTLAGVAVAEERLLPDAGLLGLRQ